jgi:hypothetical protein
MELVVLLGKLGVTHLVREFPAFYGTQRFITVLTWGPPLMIDEPSPHTPIIFAINFNIF